MARWAGSACRSRTGRSRSSSRACRAIKADTERYGLTRLGAAYSSSATGRRPPPSWPGPRRGPDASALDDFLLALARHHLGRHDEARSDCDRALARLGSDLADEATHDVAIEALMTIRGLGVDEAESLLLDLVFPASPFGPSSAEPPR